MVNDPKFSKKPTRDMKFRRILIVDDELDIRKLLQIMLEKEGYIIEVAEDGTDFLNKVDIFRPDLVTLDVMMPGLTTREILKKLEKKKSKPKIIMLTVVRYTEEEQEKMLKMNNIVEYIKKPFEFDDFIAVVKKHVGGVI